MMYRSVDLSETQLVDWSLLGAGRANAVFAYRGARPELARPRGSYLQADKCADEVRPHQFMDTQFTKCVPFIQDLGWDLCTYQALVAPVHQLNA